MVFTPAPARMTRLKSPASSIGAVTFVERTTSTSGLCVRIASTSASSLRLGSYTTLQPSDFSPSSPLCSNLSATSIFIDSLR
jgi:hypothetical protein